MNLLPADRYLIQALRDAGVELTDDDYCAFRAEVRNRVVIEPGKPQAGFDPISALIMVVIGVGLQIAASFLKPQQRAGGRQGQTRTSQVSGRDVTANQRFAPRVGFDSFQAPATLGSTIPVVYARRQQLPEQANPPRPAGVYGGIRVNTELIWSQLLSVGGSQIMKAMFLVGEANIDSLDCNAFAIGNNSLSGYDLSNGSSDSGRLTFYFSQTGGRLTSANYIAGRLPASDTANAENDGGQDVYAVRSTDYVYQQDFCYASKPSAATSFGLYSLIPNGLAVRINPRIRPTRTFNTRTVNSNTIKVDAEDDLQALAELWKSKYCWSPRAGITSTSTGGTSLQPGDTFVYVLSNSCDAETEIRFNIDNTDISDPDIAATEKCGDVASIVSGRQRTADDALILGEVYKAGSALAVLFLRSPDDVFQSDSDNAPVGGGVTMGYYFKVVRAGQVGILPLTDITQPDRSGNTLLPTENSDLIADPGARFKTATGFPQIFRCAIADVIAPRETRILEIGIRSTVGISVSGLCNFRDCDTIRNINFNAGDRYDPTRETKNYKIDKNFYISIFQSGSLTTPELRYSFFSVYYRNEADEYVKIPAAFGARSMTSQAVYNYLRFQMPSLKRWEFKIEPLSGWEVRNGDSGEPLCVLDAKMGTLQVVSAAGVVVYWNGAIVPRTESTFSLGSLDPKEDIGLSWTEGSTMTDSWGRLAEAFVYQEIQTTAASSPEHEVVYINTITPNETPPLYDNLAVLGLNIRAATEWQQFSQLSAYVNGGRRVPRLLDANAFGSSNLFPDILRDLMLNSTFGAGGILSVDQVDSASFEAAAQWCQDRRYFYDGVIAERTNLREWAADTAGTMLLDLIQRNGKFHLEPAVTFGAAVPIKALFTAGNIVEGTFALEFLEEDEREPIQASVKWREERARDAALGLGFFPVEREVLVREASRPDTDSIESFDLSDYCTNLEHAVDFACYVIRMRRLVTHSVKFTTTPDGLIAGIAAGDYIKVAMDYAYYDEFANGVVLPDGRVLTTRSDLLTTGTHDVVAWNGGDAAPYDTTLTISGGGLGSPTGIAFVKKMATTNVRVYKIESLNINQNGEIEIEAVHHPVDSSGISEVTKNWTTYVTDANWIIER